ncbi:MULTISPECIES: FlxA-like family protein [Cysteiniphilum]|uniref:FlxA-like family protein n=1 Tax=Cysteiniphilum TaxID=2056696 RepID=UPI001785DA0B|nr:MULTISPECIES: FlxA-like family protein [Cysteiniphilum]
MSNLQSQIKSLQAQIEQIAQMQKDAQKKAETQDKAAKSVTGFDTGKYFFWDDNLMTPFGAGSSSKVPLTYLKDRAEMPDQSLALGGKMEWDATQWWGNKITVAGNYNDYKPGFTNGYQSGRGLYLNEGDVYFVGNLSHYIQTDLTITGTSYSTPTILDAFVTFGNLKDTPFYLTVGKNRLTFGSFANGAPWAAGFTQGFFRPNHNVVSANLGFYKDGINLNAAYFQANKQSGDFMLSGFYDGHYQKFIYGGTIGYMYNWLGVMGASSNVNKAVYNADGTPGKQVNDNRNGVVNLEGYFGYDIYTLNGGATTTTNKEDYSNNSVLGAWYLQATASPNILGESTQFSFGYQQAYNTQNIPYPIAGDASKGPEMFGAKSEYVAYITRPVLSKNNLVSLEYAYMDTYDHKHTNALTLDITTFF